MTHPFDSPFISFACIRTIRFLVSSHLMTMVNGFQFFAVVRIIRPAVARLGMFHSCCFKYWHNVPCNCAASDSRLSSRLATTKKPGWKAVTDKVHRQQNAHRFARRNASYTRIRGFSCSQDSGETAENASDPVCDLLQRRVSNWMILKAMSDEYFIGRDKTTTARQTLQQLATSA